jgi:hypothetical protein
MKRAHARGAEVHVVLRARGRVTGVGQLPRGREEGKGCGRSLHEYFGDFGDFKPFAGS